MTLKLDLDDLEVFTFIMIINCHALPFAENNVFEEKTIISQQTF
jgi:hypothetical protein